MGIIWSYWRPTEPNEDSSPSTNNTTVVVPKVPLKKLIETLQIDSSVGLEGFFEYISVDLIPIIFSYLNWDDIFRSSQVCKRFYLASHSDVLWQSMIARHFEDYSRFVWYHFLLEDWSRVEYAADKLSSREEFVLRLRHQFPSKVITIPEADKAELNPLFQKCENFRIVLADFQNWRTAIQQKLSQADPSAAAFKSNLVILQANKILCNYLTTPRCGYFEVQFKGNVSTSTIDFGLHTTMRPTETCSLNKEFTFISTKNNPQSGTGVKYTGVNSFFKTDQQRKIKIKENDIVGFGLLARPIAVCFATLNGEFLGYCFFDMRTQFIPTLFVHTLGVEMIANFGFDPFCFDLGKFKFPSFIRPQQGLTPAQAFFEE